MVWGNAGDEVEGLLLFGVAGEVEVVHAQGRPQVLVLEVVQDLEGVCGEGGRWWCRGG